MANKNKFGFEPIAEQPAKSDRKRSVGPMGAAVREVAESLQESTEAKVEQRRQNAVEAKEFRQAQQEGRVLVNIPIDSIDWDDLPRDRIDLDEVAESDAMEELMTSIASRGQREPIEVYRDGSGRYQLKKGWRRLTALRRLHQSSGGDQFASVVARVAGTEAERLGLYIDMVEENVVREDLTFAEMANVAIVAARDPAMDIQDAEQAVNALYNSLHKMKRSYIRAFVHLLEQLGPALKWPKSVARNTGAEVSRKLRNEPALVSGLKQALERCADEAAQQQVLADFLVDAVEPKKQPGAAPQREKFEFHVGAVKVTARNGEIRIVGKVDYTEVPKDTLELAVRAFQSALGKT